GDRSGVVVELETAAGRDRLGARGGSNDVIAGVHDVGDDRAAFAGAALIDYPGFGVHRGARRAGVGRADEGPFHVQRIAEHHLDIAHDPAEEIIVDIPALRGDVGAEARIDPDGDDVVGAPEYNLVGDIER